MKSTHSLVMCAYVVVVASGCSAPPDGGPQGGGWSWGEGAGADSGQPATSGSGSGGSVSTGSGSSSGGSPNRPATGGSSSGASSSGSAATGSGSSGSASGSSSGNSDGGAAPNPNMVSFQTVPYTIAAGMEAVQCQDFKNPLGQDVAIIESDSMMSAGSHHMFVFSDSSIANQNTNVTATCSGIEFHDFVHVSQTPVQTMQYPQGVGKKFTSGQGVRILTHYLNAGSTSQTGQVSVNLHWAQLSSVQRVAVGLFLNNALLVVPTGMSTQSRTTGAMPADINVLIAVSHMHKSATNFKATTSAGQTIYQGTQWSDPVPTKYNPALVITKGTTITWACTYNNMSGMALTFGESAATNEMCILAGIAYPSQAGLDLGSALQSVL
jgi:hypothetical protein